MNSDEIRMYHRIYYKIYTNLKNVEEDINRFNYSIVFTNDYR